MTSGTFYCTHFMTRKLCTNCLTLPPPLAAEECEDCRDGLHTTFFVGGGCVGVAVVVVGVAVGVVVGVVLGVLIIVGGGVAVVGGGVVGVVAVVCGIPCLLRACAEADFMQPCGQNLCPQPEAGCSACSLHSEDCADGRDRADCQSAGAADSHH